MTTVVADNTLLADFAAFVREATGTDQPPAVLAKALAIAGGAIKEDKALLPWTQASGRWLLHWNGHWAEVYQMSNGKWNVRINGKLAERQWDNEEHAKEVAEARLMQLSAKATKGWHVTKADHSGPPTIAIDLDGTICGYEGWQGPEHFGTVREGCVEALAELHDAGWRIIIHTTRGNTNAVAEFLTAEDVPFDYINQNPDQPKDANPGKPIADVYVDDRAISAQQPWPEILAEVLGDKGRAGPAEVAPSEAHTGSVYSTGPPPSSLIDVPDIRQRNHWECGACSAASVGRYFGVGPKELSGWVKALGTSLEHSTDPNRIVAYLRQLGLFVAASSDMTIADLELAASEGYPAICCVQDYGNRREEGASFAYGHYLTVIGVGLGMVFCQDSSIENVEHEPGGDVAPSAADRSGNIATPGRIMVEQAKWLEVWHDQTRDGRKLVRYGIVVGPGKSVPVQKARGGKCKPGETSAKTGCIPQEGPTNALPTTEGKKKPAGPKKPAAFQKYGSITAEAQPVLTEDEDDALNHYTASAWVNDELRGVEVRPEATMFSDARRDDVRKWLKDAFAKVKPMKRPVKVYRGLHFYSEQEKKDFLANCQTALETGNEVGWPGYSSTSPSESAAKGYMDPDGVLLEVAAIKGLDLTHYGHGDSGGELLLDHNSKVVIESVRREGDYTVVKVRQVK